MKIAFLFIFTSLLIAQTHHVSRLSSEKKRNPAEVSVAINPKNPNQIIGTSFFRSKRGITNARYISENGGKTWKESLAYNPENRTQGDDAVTISKNGTIYHSYISFSGLRTKRPKNATNGIFITKSKNFGKSWEKPVPVVDHLNTVIPFEDKPWLITDNTDSEFENNLYISWTRFDKYNSADPSDSTQIVFSRSVDGGKSFEMPFRISDAGGDCLDGDNTVEGAVPSVGKNGEVYVIWSGPKGMMFDKSLDGGITFGKDRKITDIPGGWDIDIEGISRHNGMPVNKVDLSDGKYSGSIYVNWIDERNGDPDVFVAYSRNNGETWSKPIRVNKDKVRNGKAQFFTWMAVDPIDGSVNIVFYDRRHSDNTSTKLILARSEDGGQSFTEYPITLNSFECNKNVFFGDYLGIDAYDGRVVPIFQHFISEKKLAVSAAVFQF
jgi:hypothetical protein